jgi:hypothetical protein
MVKSVKRSHKSKSPKREYKKHTHRMPMSLSKSMKKEEMCLMMDYPELKILEKLEKVYAKMTGEQKKSIQGKRIKKVLAALISSVDVTRPSVKKGTKRSPRKEKSPKAKKEKSHSRKEKSPKAKKSAKKH